jgi:hypothetical protein
MNNALTTYCEVTDYIKDLLFNATTKEQEEQARKQAENNRKQGEDLYIN